MEKYVLMLHTQGWSRHDRTLSCSQNTSQNECLTLQQPGLFLHIPSSWVKTGWHTENQLPGTPQLNEKLPPTLPTATTGNSCKSARPTMVSYAWFNVNSGVEFHVLVVFHFNDFVGMGRTKMTKNPTPTIYTFFSFIYTEHHFILVPCPHEHKSGTVSWAWEWPNAQMYTAVLLCKVV